MAQLDESSDLLASDRGPRARWRALRVVARRPSQPVAAGATTWGPGEAPNQLSEPSDPGLVWQAGLPVERASPELTMRDLLSTWRSAERRLEGMPEGAEEWALVRAQIVALSVAYQRLFAQIRRESALR